MIEIKIRKLIWDAWNLNHIKKHKVRKEEVFEAVKNIIDIIPTYKERIMLYGTTKALRHIAIIMEENHKNEFYVVTAREMSRKEKKIWQIN